MALAVALALTALHPEAAMSRRLGRAVPVPAQGGPRERVSSVGVFLERGFPSPEIEPPDEASLRSALDGPGTRFLDAGGLAAWLRSAGSDAVLVMPYGSAFPREAWPAIAHFLEAGGSLVNIGGVPFGTPVTRESGAWSVRAPSSTFYKQLGFTHAFEVPTRDVASWQPADPAATASPLLEHFTARSVFALDARLSNSRDFPDEDGTTGQREARLAPLVVGVNAAGTRVAAPFVRLDRLEGRFAGGAWLLAPVRGHVDASAVRVLVDQARAAAVDFVVRPGFAGFHPGETPRLLLQLRRPRRHAESESFAGAAECLVEVLEASGKAVVTGHARLEGGGEWRTGTFAVDARPLARGLYKVRATLDLAAAPSVPPLRLRSTTGFWIYDTAMLDGGTPLAASGDLFVRGGQPFPVVGTTYMASDVHRKFLLEPNAYAWDRDFAAMRASGVNLVRTGLWTGWKIYMPEVGTLNETFLRSLDVFLLTARKHGIPVIFTFFAFLPEAWGGQNPFLDPTSVSAQAAFTGLVARRYAGVKDVAWDLINEPSFSSPAQLWKTRPNYDAFEAEAWRQWLARAHPGADDAPLLAWDGAPGEAASLPPLDSFTDRNLFGLSRPRQVLDYRLFAQDAFAAWTRHLRDILRTNGNREQLVTVGQDEGGLTERPGPLFFGADVDFTCMHTWWNNDALAWDSVLSKRPDRPLLVEETGLMRYERVDGMPWRTEAQAAELLERKLAIAFGTGSAGTVQWIWNTNPYMASDNEAGIGFFRADGTARPELKPFAELARFISANAARFVGRAAEDVVLLVPQSHVLSVRDYGTEATRRAVRALYYRLHVPVRAVGEYQVEATLGNPRVIIAPSPTVLTDTAWNALMKAVDAGATLVLTGSVERDQYWRPVGRLARLGVEATARPVAGDETIRIAGEVFHAGYRGEKLEKVETSQSSPSAKVETIAVGRGKILWSPLPLELAEPIEPTVAFYREGLRVAGVSAPVTVTPADPGVFVGANRFADAVLVVLASEGSADRQLEVRLAGGGEAVDVSLPAQRALLLLLDARTGKELARSNPPGL